MPNSNTQDRITELAVTLTWEWKALIEKHTGTRAPDGTILVDDYGTRTVVGDELLEHVRSRGKQWAQNLSNGRQLGMCDEEGMPTDLGNAYLRLWCEDFERDFEKDAENQKQVANDWSAVDGDGLDS